MSQKKVSGIIFCFLLMISLFVLGYLVGVNQNRRDVEVTYTHSSAAEDRTGLNKEQEETADSGLIDLNRADQKQLETLPGIGPELATRILEYRTSIGVFESVEQLKNVDGIGEKRYAQIESLVTVGGMK